MTTAIDTNVVIALWDKDPTLSLAAQNALEAAFNRGTLIAVAPVFAELIAAPGRSEAFVGGSPKINSPSRHHGGPCSVPRLEIRANLVILERPVTYRLRTASAHRGIRLTVGKPERQRHILSRDRLCAFGVPFSREMARDRWIQANHRVG
jgi:hypothetical protein